MEKMARNASSVTREGVVKSIFEVGLILAFFSAFMYVGVTDYACKPYEPRDECALGRYEIRVHALDTRERRTIAVVEGECVYAIGQGKSRRFVMPEATFTALDKTDFFEKGVEIPEIQATVCEVK